MFVFFYYDLREKKQNLKLALVFFNLELYKHASNGGVCVFCNKQYYNFLTFSLLFLDIFSEVLKVSLERESGKMKKKMAGFQITICFQFQIQKQKEGLNLSCTDLCGS